MTSLTLFLPPPPKNPNLVPRNSLTSLSLSLEMVSKVVKRIPTKSLRNRKNPPFTHRRSRTKSPIKNIAAATVASINKSIYTCHRNLIKIFTKLSRIATPRKTPRKKGYKILEKTPSNPPSSAASDVRRSLSTDKYPLPPPLNPRKNTIFLDLDETLVHSTATVPPDRYDFIVRPVIDGEKSEFYVLKRPFVDEFLGYLSEKFEIVIFTAGIEEYASLVLDKLDWRKAISHRLYRNSCKAVDGKYVKDLAESGRELSRVVIIDDNPNSYQFQPANAIPIRPFVDDLGDEELRKMMELFEGCDLVEDLRDFIRDKLCRL